MTPRQPSFLLNFLSATYEGPPPSALSASVLRDSATPRQSLSLMLKAPAPELP
jgi:hypothetical protein